jgi:tetratricopeptide (TPR) repeat protein
MFEYKATEEFDIGAGHGRYEYDFFAINGEDDFVALMKYYGAVYRRFNYFLDGYNEKIENNTELSPVVQAKMEEHIANLCLTLIEEKFNVNNAGIRQMVVNVQKPNGIYETYFSQFYYFDTVRARDYLERGNAYLMSGLYNAAIRHYSHAIKLDQSMGVAFILRGVSYLYTKNYGRAIEDFTQGITFNAENSTAFSYRGRAYQETGDLDKARADFAKALELNPDDEMAKEGLEQFNAA